MLHEISDNQLHVCVVCCVAQLNRQIKTGMLAYVYTKQVVAVDHRLAPAMHSVISKVCFDAHRVLCLCMTDCLYALC